MAQLHHSDSELLMGVVPQPRMHCGIIPAKSMASNLVALALQADGHSILNSSMFCFSSTLQLL
jgi:hypothetical protein